MRLARLAALSAALLAACTPRIDEKEAARLVQRADGFPAPATIHVARRWSTFVGGMERSAPFTPAEIALMDPQVGMMLSAGLVRATDQVTETRTPPTAMATNSFYDPVHGSHIPQKAITYPGRSHYSHRIEVGRRAGDEEAERDWSDDTNAEYARMARGTGVTLGWEVEVARPTVTEVGDLGIGGSIPYPASHAMPFTWQWRFTKSGQAFDRTSDAHAKLPRELREYTTRFKGGIDPASSHRGVAYLRRAHDRWEVTSVSLGEGR